MTVDNTVATAVITGAVATIVWLVRLEGRMNVHDERYRTIVANIGEMKSEVKGDLAKIERNVDASMAELRSDRRDLRGELARMTRAIDRLGLKKGDTDDPERT